MPNLLDIRRRIRSVKNTQQITQAMKMVSAAKLRRAQAQALAARPYAQHLYALMEDLAAFLDRQEMGDARIEGTELPMAALLERRPIKRRLIIIVSADQGLAGAFNSNVFKAVSVLAAAAPTVPSELELVGRKARDSFRRQRFPIVGEHLGVFGRTVDFAVARAVAASVMKKFAAGEVDEVVIVGNEFKSVLQQVVSTRRLLPLDVPEKSAGQLRDYLFETPPPRLFADLLPRFLEAQIYRSLLESFASEHAARMNAMEAATSNAGDLIDSLTLGMNRVRQAAITKEIIEVVSGAAALG